MKVYGIEITPEQISAAEQAMTGKFRHSQIAGVLERAGVPYDDWVSHRAADRLLQKNRKAGKIRAINNRVWERL